MPSNNRFLSDAYASALLRRASFSAPNPGRYAAMTHAALASVALVVFASSAQAQDTWPSDVAQFIERRTGCDHFRGEEPYDKERREFLNQKMTELCPGTDKALANLKDKYRRNKKIMAVLNEYEPQIEPPAPTK